MTPGKESQDWQAADGVDCGCFHLAEKQGIRHAFPSVKTASGGMIGVRSRDAYARDFLQATSRGFARGIFLPGAWSIVLVAGAATSAP